MKTKYTIKAAFVDCIEMLQHRRKELKNVNNKIKYLGDCLHDLTKEELIHILNNYNYEFTENSYIEYTRKYTEEEIEKEKESIKRGINYDISKLKKWCERSEENKEQILSYLKRNNIKIKGL
jgi:hypothetical protein